MKTILQKLFPKTCEAIWAEGYDHGLKDGFENAEIGLAWEDVLIEPHEVSGTAWFNRTEGNA